MTRRPSPSGREERSFRTQKDDEAAEGTSVFGNAFSFAGGRGNGSLGQLDKPSTTCSQKERRRTAQRERLQFSRGSGLATQRCSAGISRRGAHAMREPFSSALSARIGSGVLRASEEFQRPASLAVGGPSRKGTLPTWIVLAHCGWLVSPEANIAQTQE